MHIRKNKQKAIPISNLFSIWEKYGQDYLLTVICPYCHEITSIWGRESNQIHLKCRCIIPEKPTPQVIEIKLIRRRK